MRTAYLAARLEAKLTRWQRAAVAAALVLAVSALVGWATGVQLLTQTIGNWPPMRPWTAVTLTALGIAVLLQSAQSTAARVWVGRGLAAAAVAVGVLFLVEFATGTWLGFDDVWFPDAIRRLEERDVGRTPLVATLPLLLLSVAVSLTRVRFRWAAPVWTVALLASTVLPFFTVGSYLFGAISSLNLEPERHSSSISAAIATLLLIVAESLACTERRPVAWMLARPDRALLFQLAGILISLPVLTAMGHSIVDMRGLDGGRHDQGWTAVLLIVTAVCAWVVFAVVERDRRQRHATEEQFTSIVQSAPNAIAVHNVRHGFEFANPTFCRLVGAEADELIGRPPEGVLSADPVMARRVREAERAAERGKSSTFEQDIKVGDELLVYEIQMFPVDSDEGSTPSVGLIGTDVTERKRVERELRQRIAVEDRISNAIRDGQLLLFAQPIVDAITGQLVEEELLVRLAGPDGGYIPPDQFLPDAKRFALMPTIDRFMVTNGIGLARTGRHVAVNLSADSINDPAVLDAIVGELAAAGDVAGRVSFEVTESAALASAAAGGRFSEAMNRLGCKVALDDFGTGFGGFTELRGMRLHKLKIDQSFVRGLLQNKQDESVVRMIVGIAREFGLVTTAEGVEDEATRTRLIELGVDQLQGYLIGKPAPVSPPAAVAIDHPALAGDPERT